MSFNSTSYQDTSDCWYIAKKIYESVEDHLTRIEGIAETTIKLKGLC